MLSALSRVTFTAPAYASYFSSLTTYFSPDSHSFIRALNKQPMTNLQKNYDQKFDRNPQERLTWLFSANWDWVGNPELASVYDNDPAPVKWLDHTRSQLLSSAPKFDMPTPSCQASLLRKAPFPSLQLFKAMADKR